MENRAASDLPHPFECDESINERKKQSRLRDGLDGNRELGRDAQSGHPHENHREQIREQGAEHDACHNGNEADEQVLYGIQHADPGVGQAKKHVDADFFFLVFQKDVGRVPNKRDHEAHENDFDDVKQCGDAFQIDCIQSAQGAGIPDVFKVEIHKNGKGQRENQGAVPAGVLDEVLPGELKQTHCRSLPIVA